MVNTAEMIWTASDLPSAVFCSLPDQNFDFLG